MRLASIAKDYAARHRPRARRELHYYAIQRSLIDVIEKAALSCLPGGKRHPHQRRIPGAVLAAAERKLQRQAGALAKAASFEGLHDLVREAIGPIRGIGDLAVYDIAHRIGAYLKHEPELIYLHAGTRAGARALGLSGKSLTRSELPRALRGLKAFELEDCLCIYKAALRGGGKHFRSCLSGVTYTSPSVC